MQPSNVKLSNTFSAVLHASVCFPVPEHPVFSPRRSTKHLRPCMCGRGALRDCRTLTTEDWYADDAMDG